MTEYSILYIGYVHKNTNYFGWMKIINSSMSFTKGKVRWVFIKHERTLL